MSELQKTKRAYFLRVVVCTPFIIGCCLALDALPSWVTAMFAGAGVGALFDFAIIGPARQAWFDARPDSWQSTALKALELNDSFIGQVTFWRGVATRQRAAGMGSAAPRREDLS